MQERESALREWLLEIMKHEDFSLIPLAGDASFRKYFRLHAQESTFVVMDAPPEREKIDSFIHISTVLTESGVLTPQILAKDLKQGFLLLNDFGDQLLLSHLNDKTVDPYYHEAINILFKIQSCSVEDPNLLSFDKVFMLQEMNLCSEWFLKKYLNLDLKEEEWVLIKESMNWIAEEVSNQPLTFIHRDYHSRNLMILEHSNTLGVIDFQDAMRGPLTYDLVSLLKDCYISWPRERLLTWLTFFYEHNSLAKSHYSFPELVRAFDLCGLQRHLKVLGVFCRLYLRDNKSGYLSDLPLVLRYVLECSEIYKELHPLFNFLQNRVSLP